MRRTLLALLCTLAFAMPVFAQAPAPLSLAPAPLIRSGTYAVQGTAPDGTAYEGALELQATGPQSWRLTWRIAGDTTIGAGLSVGDRLVFGYRSEGEVGTGFYEPQSDGRITGRWTQGAQGGVGTEVLSPR
ncbi:hypothetical protein [Plastoroseomonas arctica]|uniref:Fibronectin-binding protein n=1 Tax=Plastoroseomonas arctica TaxID=1509237 RepID=A0AAF1K5I7_9PROT|nr:hypothetical protein [Plastoroseomonas arctica]MBR0656615.1 hypothetical protein [Plastoroseomonas arctica]